MFNGRKPQPKQDSEYEKVLKNGIRVRGITGIGKWIFLVGVISGMWIMKWIMDRCIENNWFGY